MPFKKPSAAAAVAEGVTESGASKVKLRTKAVTYLKNIYLDYKEVAIDTVKAADARPFRALTYGLIGAGALVLYKTNPSQHDYESQLVELGNELIMCGKAHSARSEYYLSELNKLANMRLIEYQSFLFFSLIRLRYYSEGDCNYESRCQQLNNPNKLNVFNWFNKILQAISRTIDIGYCGHWYFLDKHFHDYDIDEKEWVDKK